ncbi:MAG: twitching motility protein PilT [Lachnospiraceae bacterium]|nr:twitching motility protein PilT [Lachnospiraceae bacterium]
MVQIIVGKKGKGKTKYLLDKVNEDVQKSSGSIVYLDKSTKHMFELNNKIRLINVKDYLVESADGFLGFICGIISQDHDLERMYLDSFLTLACVNEPAAVSGIVKDLHKISDNFKVDFVISVSLDESELPEEIKSNVIISL